MNILFIGTGYFPTITSGEKNFFFRLLPLLREHCHIAVFSLNDHKESVLHQETPYGEIPIFCGRRPFHKNYERFYFRSGAYTAYHHRHRPLRESFEKLLSIVTHLARLRTIINTHNIQIIHFLDNFGLSMPFLRTLFPKVLVTYSAANYDPRGRTKLYDTYLRLSIGYLNGAGVYTEAYLHKLRQLGIGIPLALTPWGVPIPEDTQSRVQKDNIRKMLGIEDGQFFLLWSGYLQQIQENDYYKTIRVARAVNRVRSDVSFVFAFKPETYQPSYADYADERIRVISGLDEFGTVLAAADLLCSPIGNTLSTVSPPLTWLEAMSVGTPVITTEVGGVEEVIEHGETGYIAENYDDLAAVMIESIENDSLNSVSQSAKVFISNNFDIKDAAIKYSRFWRNLAE